MKADLRIEAYDMDHHDAYHIGLDKKNFKVPGKTPLQQLMWAQLIMGPCKAHQKNAHQKNKVI